MKKVLLSIFLMLTGLAASAQSGNYFLSHYSPDNERFNIVCFDMVQDNRGVFYFATQAGILQFDGRNWDIIQTIGTIYSIALQEGGDIYAAGSRGFGKIIRDENNLETFTMLYEQGDAEYIFQIAFQANKVYFLSDKNLYIFDTSTEKITSLSSTSETGPFVSLNEFTEQIYISTEWNGLMRLDKDELSPSSIGNKRDLSLIFSLKHNDHYLVGSENGQLYLSDGGRNFSEVKIQDSVYAKASVMVNATWVTDQLVAIGTLRGGIIFLNPFTGATEEIINYNTGLPDNEVFTLLTDRNLNVWVSHAYGFTRISPFLPFRSFRYYDGLEGNLLCATTYKDNVYVGTSLGLYILEKKEFYDEIPYYVDIPVRKQTTRKITTKEPVPETRKEPVVESRESQKGGFFKFLKKKKPDEAKTGNENQDKDPGSVEEEHVESVNETEYRREKRIRKVLRTAHFAYRRIDGIDAKISQLIHWKGKLIASGIGGAYEISEYESVNITDKPVRFLFASESRNTLIASTHDDHLLHFRYDTNWTEGGTIDNIREPIHYIFEESDQAIWFCGFDKVFRLVDASSSLEQHSFNNSNFDKTIGLYLNKAVIIASPLGFYFYNRNTQKLEKGDTLRTPQAYFANATNLWFRDKHNWYTAGSAGGHDNLQLLNLFNNIRFIDSDKNSGTLWIITGNNELLEFYSGLLSQNEVIYPLMLKSVQHENIVTARNYLKVEQDDGAFMVEVVKPDYIGTRFVEYRYRLEGLHQDWTEWSTQNNEIRFPYLPTGEYKLHVQSRDIFGRINDMEPVTLDIEPPYWKQPWFYAAEFSIFVFLVLLSFRLSYRFLVLSRLLSLLSIIIFIEFIQTAAGETFSQSSPVIDFGIQVFVAILILPIEGFLRKYFLQSIAKMNEERMIKRLKAGKKVPEYETEYPNVAEITAAEMEKK